MAATLPAIAEGGNMIETAKIMQVLGGEKKAGIGMTLKIGVGANVAPALTPGRLAKPLPLWL
jgi:hypothetical protein